MYYDTAFLGRWHAVSALCRGDRLDWVLLLMLIVVEGMFYVFRSL